uniref:Uncharacterized protein n=1 Tax=Corvus moneduloides TaxID=1196302 RepID=A0A8C3H167_CORMO
SPPSPLLQEPSAAAQHKGMKSSFHLLPTSPCKPDGEGGSDRLHCGTSLSQGGTAERARGRRHGEGAGTQDIFNAAPRTCSRHRQKVPDCQPSQEFRACELPGREPRREFSVPRFFPEGARRRLERPSRDESSCTVQEHPCSPQVWASSHPLQNITCSPIPSL